MTGNSIPLVILGVIAALLAFTGMIVVVPLSVISQTRRAKKVISTIYRSWARRRTERQLRKIRTQIERCGYDLQHLSDPELEAAVVREGSQINETPLTAKRTYWILRRLSPEFNQFRVSPRPFRSFESSSEGYPRVNT